MIFASLNCRQMLRQIQLVEVDMSDTAKQMAMMSSANNARMLRAMVSKPRIQLTLPLLQEGQDSYAIYADVSGSRRIYGENWFAYDWLPQLVHTFPAGAFQRKAKGD
jgi:hypothetical protein